MSFLIFKCQTFLTWDKKKNLFYLVPSNLIWQFFMWTQNEMQSSNSWDICFYISKYLRHFQIKVNKQVINLTHFFCESKWKSRFWGLLSNDLSSEKKSGPWVGWGNTLWQGQCVTFPFFSVLLYILDKPKTR